MEIKDNVVTYYNGEFRPYVRFFSNEQPADPFREALGKTITNIEFDGERRLKIMFNDGTGVALTDEGQSCCETRYMTTSDHLPAFVGSRLIGGAIKDAPDSEDAYEVHEVQFLEIITSHGTFTMESHNEHNGYYGGFSIKATAIGAPHLNY